MSCIPKKMYRIKYRLKLAPPGAAPQQIRVSLQLKRISSNSFAQIINLYDRLNWHTHATSMELHLHTVSMINLITF